MSFLLLFGIGLLINGAASLLALWRSSVSPGGAVAGAVVGTLIFACGGPLFWIILMVFFVSSTGLGYVRRRDKEWLRTIHEKGGRRDALQVIANGGIGTLCAVLYRLTGNGQWAVAFAVAFAASNADTWASEIGVLSRQQPVSLLTFRPVSRGVSGGVSLLGTCMALGGAFLIGVVFALENMAGGFLPPTFFLIVLFVTGAGFLGSLVDSLLGSTVQAQYSARAVAYSPFGETLTITERGATPEGDRNRLVRGIAFVTNDVVNLVSCAVVTAAAVLLWPLPGA